MAELWMQKSQVQFLRTPDGKAGLRRVSSFVLSSEDLLAHQKYKSSTNGLTFSYIQLVLGGNNHPTQTQSTQALSL